MFTFLIIIHVIICIALIITVLLQSAKGEGLAGALGGGALSGAVFGGRGAATFLSRATSYIAVLFMLSCLGLTFISPARDVASQGSAVREEFDQGAMPGQPMEGPAEGAVDDQQTGEEFPITVPQDQGSGEGGQRESNTEGGGQ